MIYSLVEADGVIARLDNDFNVNTGDWISRVPKWIYQCLSSLNIHYSFTPKAHIALVEDGISTQPDDIHLLIGIEYEGSRLDRRPTSQYKSSTTSISQPAYSVIKTDVGVTMEGTISDIEEDDDSQYVTLDLDKIRARDASSITELPLSDDHYMLLPNGTIETTIDNGVIVYHYYSFPAAYNERLNSLCPLIPKNEEVEEAVTWYIFMSILQRGAKHPVFSIGNPNWKLDPYERYRKARLSAKVKANRGDADQNRITDSMWQSALYNSISYAR